MDVAAPPLLTLDNSFARELEGLYFPWRAASWPAPRLLVLNDDLAAELGLSAAALRAPDGVALLTGHGLPEGATPLAQAYAGHQFGGYQPRLGDGRALLLGEVHDVRGRRRDMALKGSGRTPFARGGDGLAAVGPMLREYVIAEAMHALGIPTTRALAVVATGAEVARETMLPGAVLCRVAASHLRVGTFQYAAAQDVTAHRDDPTLVRRLANYAIVRHHPEAAEAANPYLAFFERVVDAQAALVARWMLVGFVHGVMNTDNMTISGETIDYGPCAFMEAFDPATVFSSIDETGRYAYGNQPAIAQWNLARLAESLLGLIDPDQGAAVEAAVAVLQTFPERYGRYSGRGLRAKLGLPEDALDAGALVDDLLVLLSAQKVDFTGFFRGLSAVLRPSERDAGAAVRSLFAEPAAFDAWAQRWRAQLGAADPAAVAAAMDAVNPLYIPRNHQVEAALTAATAGDLDPVRALLDVVTRPFEERPGLAAYAVPAPADLGMYRTFCGT